MKIQYLGLPLMAIVLFGCTGVPEKPGADAVLPLCGARPNCVNSQTGEGAKAISPLTASREQWQALRQWLAMQEDWRIDLQTRDYLQAVVKTPLMRFRDDVQLLYDPQAGIIHVRSSSRLGIGDMGANRSRIEALRDRLAAGPGS
jgi:uncharacterized protein (DUF1499 family)